MIKLTEVKRSELLNKSKKGANYSGKRINRWNNKSKCSVANSVKDYNKIDMNTFWKKDVLRFGVKVKGETDTYTVTVVFANLQRKIQQYVKASKNKFDRDIVAKALMDALSSSDVKVDCTCLHEDTKIKLLDGTSPTIKELAQRFANGEDLWCYSVDENGVYKPGKIEKVWKTKTTKEFIKVTLDNDQEILCTPEHLFMLRNGQYCCAEDLKINDSLMPLYFKEGRKGYDQIKNNLTGRYESIYKDTANELYQDQIEQAKIRALQDDSQKMKYLVAIHHKDFNKHNNNPNNLQIMTSWEHWNYHANLCDSNRPITENMRIVAHNNAVIRNSNPTDAMLLQRQNFNKAGRQHNYELSAEELKWRQDNMRVIGLQTQQKRRLMTDEERKQLYNTSYGEQWKTNIGKSNKDVWSNYSDEQYKNRCYINHLSNLKAKDKISESLKNLYKNNPERSKSRFRSKIKKVLLTMVNNKIELTFNNYVKLASKKGCPKTLDKLLNYYPDLKTWNELIQYYELNHKVISIERISIEDTDVYDIKVAKWHNFLLDAGVIVHNCPDFKYRLAYHATKQGFKAGEAENRASNITNPNDDKGALCKHISAALNNASWIRNIASVIVNYANYCRDNMEYNYSRFIFPVIFGMQYNKAIQLCIDDFDQNGEPIDDLKTTPETINIANAIAKARFKGNKKKEEPKKQEVEAKDEEDKK